MLIPRRIKTHLDKLTRFFPAVSVTGPRQAGKTTLLRDLYPDYTYLSLEKPQVRAEVRANPDGFFAKYNDHVIFDEAQRYPDLFSHLQGMIDEDLRPGRFILSGSQNFLLRKNITQTLAGRVGIAKLLPLDIKELSDAGLLPEDHLSAMLQGGYPGRIDRGIDADIFYSAYLASYVERDVVDLVLNKNLDLFQRFVRTCATYAGQTINLGKISKSVGVSVPTVQSWLGILEQSFVIFRLQPFFRNIGKRLTKSPKLYFYDTGLLSYLLGIHDRNMLSGYDRKGAIFENMVIADAFKSFHHQGYDPEFYFYRDSNGLEADLLYERANSARFWEIKAAQKFRGDMVNSVEKIAAGWDRPTETNVIYAGEEENRERKTTKINWRNVDWRR